MLIEELKQYDGTAGRPAYVAVNGKVYDVSSSDHWVNGTHEGAHQAGADLTSDLAKAPHVRSVIERFPVVDHITEPEPVKKKGLFGIFKK